MICRSFKLFGSECEFCLDTEDFAADPIMRDAYELGLRLQKIFNVYDESSELSMLNAQRSIDASKELLEVIEYALNLCELSEGDYDISLGKNFLARKKHESLSDPSCSYKDIKVIGRTVKLLNPSVTIDLGSIAKGYIAEQLAKFFLEQGIESGYIDARGDLRVFGDKIKIAIQHPRDKGIIKNIHIQDKGVATSGDYRQYHEDYSKSHILNQKEIISATVVADDLMKADAYATILMVCTNDKREKLIKESGFSAMTIDKDLNIHYYNGFKELINEN